MSALRLLTSLKVFEALHERADKARKTVKVPKRLFEALLIDNVRLYGAAEKAGVKIVEGPITGGAEPEHRQGEGI